MLIEGIDQGIEPVVGDLRIVVEEHQILAACRCGAGIAGTDEAEIVFVVNRADAIDAGEAGAGFIAGAIIDDDDFKSDIGAVHGDRLQAGEGVRKLVVHRDDDAGFRMRGARYGKRIEGAAGVAELDAEFGGCQRCCRSVLLDALQGAANTAGAQAADHSGRQADEAISPVAEACAQIAQAHHDGAQGPCQLP